MFGMPMCTPKFESFERYIVEFGRVKGWLPSQVRAQRMGDLALFMSSSKRGGGGGVAE